MPTPRPESKWTVYLDPHQVEDLERHGARPDRTHGPAGRSSVLRRRLDLLAGLLDVSDPRETHGLSEAFFRLAIELLPDAHLLPPTVIRTLDAHFAILRALPAAAAEAGVDRGKFLKAIAALPYAQRFFLVDFAEQENARRETEQLPATSSRPLRRARRGSPAKRPR
jgi:hypothetical protein